MPFTHLPPPEHDRLRTTTEADDSRLHLLEEKLRGLTFDDFRTYCLDQEPTATVGIFVLAERRYPLDSNPDAKYLMLVVYQQQNCLRSKKSYGTKMLWADTPAAVAA